MVSLKSPDGMSVRNIMEWQQKEGAAAAEINYILNMTAEETASKLFPILKQLEANGRDISPILKTWESLWEGIRECLREEAAPKQG